MDSRKMMQMNLFAEQEYRCRCREWTCGHGLGMGRVGVGGPRSLGTHCPRLPLFTEVLLLHGPQQQGCPFTSAPQAVLPVFLNRPLPGPLHGSSLLLCFKKKKKEEGIFFFLPQQKAQGLGERGKADAEMPARGLACLPSGP